MLWIYSPKYSFTTTDLRLSRSLINRWKKLLEAENLHLLASQDKYHLNQIYLLWNFLPFYNEISTPKDNYICIGI